MPKSEELYKLAFEQAMRNKDVEMLANLMAVEQPMLDPVDTLAGGLSSIPKGLAVAATDIAADIPISLALEQVAEENPEYLKAMYIGKRGMKNLGIDESRDLAGQFSGLWDRQPRLEIDDSAMKLKNLPVSEGWEDFSRNLEREKYGKRGANPSQMSRKEFNDYLKWRDKIEKEYNTTNATMKRLPSMVEHDSFAKAYPELYENISVRFDPSLGKAGAYTQGRTIEYGDFSEPEALKGLFAHEMTHGVQSEEKFAKGGRPVSVTKSDIDLWADEADAMKDALELKDIFNHSDSMEEAKKEFTEKFGRQPHRSAEYHVKHTSNINKEYEDIVKKINRLPDYLIDKNKSYDEYRRLAGEIEARDAAHRMNMSPEQRRRTQPMSGYAVDEAGNFGPSYEKKPIALEDMIVRYNAE